MRIAAGELSELTSDPAACPVACESAVDPSARSCCLAVCDLVGGGGEDPLVEACVRYSAKDPPFDAGDFARCTGTAATQVGHGTGRP